MLENEFKARRENLKVAQKFPLSVCVFMSLASRSLSGDEFERLLILLFRLSPLERQLWNSQ